MRNFRLTISVALLICAAVFAQEIEAEKTYTISRKSKRGFLAGIDYNTDEKTYQLTYFTKQTQRKLKYEFYVFDNDFNMIKDGEGEEQFELMKKKFSWFKFRDLLYTVTGVTVENNLTGTLVLKRKTTTLRYDYLLGGYIKKVQLLEKLKPKTDDGRKLTLVTKGEDDKTGDIYVLASIKPKIGRNMAEKNPRPYDLYYLKFNKELDILAETVIPFDAPQTLLAAEFTNKIDEEDPENPGIEFASIVLTSASEEKKENPYITYLRLDEKTKVVHRETVQAQEPIWRVDDVIYNRPTNEVFIMGPAAESINQVSKDKFKAFQLWKINSDGKTAYNTTTKIEEFESKLKTPPSQKKSPAYNGKKFSLKTNLVSEKGELFIGGQNYKIDQSGKDRGTRNYKDILGFHFDKNGILISQYGVDTKETNKVANDNAAPQEFIEGRGGNIFWLIREIKGVDPKYFKLLTYPRIAKIDTKEGKISDLTTLGKGEGYYLDPKYPFLQTDKGNRIVFFGSNKSGKELWFCRVNLK